MHELITKMNLASQESVGLQTEFNECCGGLINALNLGCQ